MLIDSISEDTKSKSNTPYAQLAHRTRSSDTPGKSIMNISAFSMKGRRTHMEDFFDIGFQMKPIDQQRPNEWPYEYFYFGIFDGHGGYEAAKFAKENLLKFITNQIDFWSDNDDDVKRAIERGFYETHHAMRNVMHTWSRSSQILPSTAGTTASILFIKNGKFYTGHVGDSRIVIANEHPTTKQWIARQLTEDHKPESRVELKRIERAGGEVRSKIGVHRVVWRRPILDKALGARLVASVGNSEIKDDCLDMVTTYPIAESLIESYQMIPFLAIARSLGDFWSYNPYSGQYTVSPEPDVASCKISPHHKCILLATDGLWNVMNSSNAIRVLQELNVIRNGQGRPKGYRDQYYVTDNFYDVSGCDGQNHALSLVYAAYQVWERRRLRSDNISSVVVMMDDILDCQRSTKVSSTRKNQLDAKFMRFRSDIVRLGQTRQFCERIHCNKRPGFYPSDKSDEDCFYLRKLEDYLLFPPTLMEREFIWHYNYLLYPPPNYVRLSQARVKRLRRKDSSDLSFIYIKKVTDDPDDLKVMPKRKSKSGKEVRDASAQATQSMHDFGQPWNQLLMGYDDRDYELVFRHELREGDEVLDDDYDDDDDPQLPSPSLFDSIYDYDDELSPEDYRLTPEDEEESVNEDEDDEDEECSDEDDEDDQEDDVLDEEEEEEDQDQDQCKGTNEELATGQKCLSKSEKTKPSSVKSEHKQSSKKDEQKVSLGDSAIPQLRCLMNCDSPTLRRSTRSRAYLSLTENPKRKNQLSPESPKMKRRKSSPVQCTVAQA